MKRSASAEWKGGIKDGRGTMSTDSKAIANLPYTFSTRFEDAPGTNPEELIGAAHAGCFSMAFSGHLNAANLTAESIRTTADVTVEKVEGGFGITAVHLTVRARVPGATEEQFRKAAETAKSTCPVSKVLNAKITMDAKLEG